MDKRPVGVFDSGLGGASVLREALRILPTEHYIYFGDNKNAPYGDKSEQEILELSLKSADFLLSFGIKVMLFACNTATGTAIKQVREKLSIPVISIEPAIKPACEAVGDGTILMLATKATTQMERYHKLKARMPQSCRIIDIPCPGFVERIEQGVFGIGEYDDLFDKHLGEFKGERVDAIVLGCTHYIFIKEVLAEYAQRNFLGECRFFDGNLGTVRQLARVLKSKDMLNNQQKPTVDFYTSGDEARLKPLFEKLLYS
ncbi:MAG TPA: glutamate racemase [Clostridiales bacterium]|jgi:glutamate racemase|nr:glutamate racemase [Clostridiales bacterium]